METNSEKIERLQALNKKLIEASDAYYNGKGELMTDYEWDKMFDEVKKLQAETGSTINDLSSLVTENVSADDIIGQKEEHEFPALSLAKTKQPMELVKWAEGKPIWLSWKLDGLTLVVTFDNGHLSKVVTRGNGHIGTNITHLSTAIKGIPQKIKYDGHVVIRGECVIAYEDFNNFLLESDEDYTNPRNLASGSLTLKDLDEVKRRHLQWIPFTLVHSDNEINSWGERMEFIKANGMNTVDHELINIPTQDNINNTIDKWTKKVTSKECPYPVDGLVIAYDDYAYSQTGSVTGHHATRAGYAFKWQDESATTLLDHIEWSCAASTISPVAVFNPIELEGTTVKRASLCNISECERLGIGDKGTKLNVIKANKIIPKVINIEEKAGELHIPDTCPVCGAPTEIIISQASGTKTLHCTNSKCPAKQLKKFRRFVSKEGMNIDGISEQTIARFVNTGWINEYADIYKLNDHIIDISFMEGFGDKSARNIAKSLEKASTVEARNLLYALNIPLVGQDVCNRLLSIYPLSELISLATTTEHEDEFAKIAGIGPEKSATVVTWFHNSENKRIVDNLLPFVKIVQESGEPKGNKCEGLTFVITGDVHHYKNRSELKAYIESQGGKVTGSVSKSTSYLINNDVSSTSGKNKTAIHLNTPIISEDNFIEQFGI